MPIRNFLAASAALVLLFLAPACGDDEDRDEVKFEEEKTVARQMQLTSEAFGDGDEIPVKYTCDGEDVSPPLRWDDAPPTAQSFALIMDDPDAPGGTFDHWLVYAMPPEARDLPEAANIGERANLGTNSRGKTVYMGPCPPPGPAHTYRFRLFALTTELNLEEGASKAELLEAMEGRVLDEALLTGRFGRS